MKSRINIAMNLSSQKLFFLALPQKLRRAQICFTEASSQHPIGIAHLPRFSGMTLDMSKPNNENKHHASKGTPRGYYTILSVFLVHKILCLTSLLIGGYSCSMFKVGQCAPGLSEATEEAVLGAIRTHPGLGNRFILKALSVIWQ